MPPPPLALQAAGATAALANSSLVATVGVLGQRWNSPCLHAERAPRGQPTGSTSLHGPSEHVVPVHAFAASQSSPFTFGKAFPLQAHFTVRAAPPCRVQIFAPTNEAFVAFLTALGQTPQQALAPGNLATLQAVSRAGLWGWQGITSALRQPATVLSV